MHSSLRIPALPCFHAPIPSHHHHSVIINPILSHIDCKPLPHFNVHAPQLQLKFPLPWNPLQMFISNILDKFEATIISALENQHPLQLCADPQAQLEGNFSPVPENAVQYHLKVEGTIPESLGGMYVRNGANPMFRPVAGHHLFDGDGMLHAVSFKQGVVSYVNRFTKTYRLLVEEKLGRAFFPKVIGEFHGHGGLARLILFYARSIFGLVDSCMGMGVANAGVIFFDGHLLAMSEDDLPYAVKITSAGDLQTLGRYDFDGQLRCHMIPHPKLDANTGELFALSYDVTKKPYLQFFKFSPDGRKGPAVAISVKEPTLMHDFAITENFAVIPDQQVVFRLYEMMKGGSPVVYDKEKMTRFGILPRNAEDESSIMWVNVPNCFCFHLWNAWEDDDDIVIIASCMNPPDCIFSNYPHAVESILSEIRLNKITVSSTRRDLISSMNLEVGQMNRYYLGRKSQFIFLAIVEPWPKVSGIMKVDLLKQVTCQSHRHHNALPSESTENETNVVAKFMYPPNCYGGEPMFVPRLKPGAADEDDGYVLTFMHNEATNKSEILILEAMSLKVLARVKLPFRVPYGFHGTFITNKEIMSQKDM